MMPNNKILILSTIWGHQSVARGISDALMGTKYKVKTKIIKTEPLSLKSYKAFYRFLPWLFTATFQASKFEPANKLLDKHFERSYFKTIESEIKKENPDIVISTYFAFDSSLEKLTHKYKYIYFNAFSDPRTFSKIHVSKNGINLVFDDASLAKVKRLSSNTKAYVTGWFTEKKYYKNLGKVEARKKLGISQRRFTICVTSGSEGTYDVLKVINSLVGKVGALQILFMCGENRQLYALVRNISRLFHKFRKVEIIPYKYTEEMEIFLRASDLVIGKAGPNTIFECVAAEVPFLAITHISGQEDGNLDLIRDYQIGFVEEKARRAAKLIKRVINDPPTLKTFQKSIKDLSRFNQASGQKLIDIISKENTKKAKQA